jgi:hypothetical protein
MKRRKAIICSAGNDARTFALKRSSRNLSANRCGLLQADDFLKKLGYWAVSAASCDAHT